MSEPSETDILGRVEAALAAGDTYGAREAVEHHLGSLAAGGPNGDWGPALAAIVRLAEQWEDGALASAAREVVDHSDDSGALLALGHRLIDLQLLVMADAVLARAVHAGPSADAVAERVAALELLGRYDDAVAAIEDSGLADEDPLCAYLLGFSGAMTRDLEPARARLPGLQARQGEPFVTLAASLAGILQRADALGDRLRPDDLRAWHFVWTGGVLLAPSPPTPRRGLVTWPELRRSLDVLGEALDAFEIKPNRLLTPPDNASRVLGSAAGALLDLPVETWRGDDAAAGLLLVHNESDLDPLLAKALRSRSPGQALYTHVADVTREQPAAGDLTGLYGLGFRAPWLGGVDDAGEFVEPEPGEPEDLARHLLDAPADDATDGDLQAFVEMISSTGLLPTVLQQDGARSRQWVLPEPFRSL